MFKKFSNYFFILVIILLTVNQPSYSELSNLNSGEVWGVSRTKINSNLTDLETRKMSKSAYDANLDGKIDSTALPTNIPTTETVGQLVDDAVTDAVADIPGSTVVPDELDPTKAAAAVVADSADSATTAGHATTADSAATAGSADSATYATTAGTAGTVAAVSGDAITSGTVADNRVASTLARDTEVSGAIEAAISTIELPEASTIVPDTVDPTKAAVAGTADFATTAGSATTAGLATVADSATTAGHATTADTATIATSANTATTATTATTAGTADYATSAGSSASVDPVKISGTPGMMSVYEAEGTSTMKTGFIGPLNSTINCVYQFPNGIPSPGDTFVMGTALTSQTLPDGSTGTIIPLSHAAGGGSTTDLLVSNFDTDAVVSTSEALTQESDDTMIPTWGAVIAKMNDIIVSGNPTIAITTPATNGLWAGATSYTAFAGTAFDMQGISEIATKVGSGGTYSTSGVTGTTSWADSTMALSEGLNTLYARVTDTTTNTSEATRTLNVDSILPVVNAGADQTHDGAGQQITVSGISITEANETARERQIYNTTDAAVESGWIAFTGTSFAYTLPANTDSYRFDVRVTDPVRAVTDSLDVAYSGGAGTTPDVLYECEDNAASTTVLATYGNNGSLIDVNTSANTSATNCGGTRSFSPAASTTRIVTGAMTEASLDDGAFTIQFDYYADNTTGFGAGNYVRLIMEPDVGTSFMFRSDNGSSTAFLLMIGTVEYNMTLDDINTGSCQTIRIVVDAAATNKVVVYQGANEGALVAKYTRTASITTPNFPANPSLSFGSSGNSNQGISLRNGKMDDIKIWYTAVTP